MKHDQPLYNEPTYASYMHWISYVSMQNNHVNIWHIIFMSTYNIIMLTCNMLSHISSCVSHMSIYNDVAFWHVRRSRYMPEPLIVKWLKYWKCSIKTLINQFLLWLYLIQCVMRLVSISPPPSTLPLLKYLQWTLFNVAIVFFFQNCLICCLDWYYLRKGVQEVCICTLYVT